jgi:hypothetical protein
VIILVLLFGALLLARRSLISTPALQRTTQPTSQFGAMAARTPTPQPTAAVPGNLLSNSSFEEPYSSQGAGEVNVAHGWKAWYLDVPPCKPWKPDCYIPCPSNCMHNGICQKDYGCMWARPEFVPVLYEQYTYRVHTGEAAAKYFSYGRMHEAGFYQQVSGIVPGSPVEFSVWIQTWMCFNYDNCDYGHVSDQPSDMHLRIGIDPTGGTVPTSTNIIWSPEASAFDHWVYYNMQATAMASTITVFTHSRPEWDYARANNDVYVDDANLVVVGPPAEFSYIQPAQPELGQVTTIQVQSNYPHTNATLTITDPRSASVTPDGGAMSGSGPYLWTWQFTPTAPGTHTLAFSAATLPAPITSTMRALAVARLAAQPPTAMLSQTVTVRVNAYYLYPSQQLTVTDPSGNSIATSDAGIIGGYVHTWGFSSLVTGTHLITFTADLLEAPLTANVKVASIATVDSIPAAPPINTPVNIRATAYYPYNGIALGLTDPYGQPLTLAFLGRSGGTPFVWTWTFTPAITGTCIYTFTANLLDAPARGLVFAGGNAIYLPVIFKR